MHKWTYDTQRFLLEHFDTIHNSPHQIYHSALPFCPSSSWLHKCYSAEVSNEVKVVKGLPSEWGKCSRTVTFDDCPWCLSCWNHIAAVGLKSGDIIILNVTTGSHIAVLSGHSDWVYSVAFSSDGTLLVSGSRDTTVKLWDVQTGGIVKTFSGHNRVVRSVSILAEAAIIASGSVDGTIQLWNIQTGECQSVIRQQGKVYHVSFSPMEPYHLISRSGSKVRRWNMNGSQIGRTADSSGIALSLDGTKFALFNQGIMTVQNSRTEAIMTKFHIPHGLITYCFSPDSKLVTANTSGTIHIWDITNSDPHPIEALKGHANHIRALGLSSPSSLISASQDGSVKFWQIGTSSINQPETDSTPHPSDEIESITLQANAGIIVTSGRDGAVRIWDISSGLCKETFQTPASNFYQMDSQLLDGRLIVVWNTTGRVHYDIHIWDSKERGVIMIENVKCSLSLKMSGDGSRVFHFTDQGFQAFSIQTGGAVGEVWLGQDGTVYPHTIDGCRLWTISQSGLHGWDFGTPGPLPVQLSNIPPGKPHPCGTIQWDTQTFRVQDRVTEKVVFQLARGFKKPIDVQWSGQYLVVCFGPIDVLILDFNHLFLR